MYRQFTVGDQKSRLVVPVGNATKDIRLSYSFAIVKRSSSNSGNLHYFMYFDPVEVGHATSSKVNNTFRFLLSVCVCVCVTDVGVAVTDLRVVCKLITCVSTFTEMAIIFLEICMTLCDSLCENTPSRANL